MNLDDLGWRDFFRQDFEQYHEQGFIPARVAREHKEIYQIFCEFGELDARVSGRMTHNAIFRSDFPAVGDWVAISARPKESSATIHALLARKSTFSRKAILAGGPKGGLGKTDEQILAANIDITFIVSSLDFDFNARRIERYVSIAWDSGATPVVLLNKSDLCDNIQSKIDQVEEIAVGVPVYPVSAVTGDGLDELENYFVKGQTSALLGSSGVGKSTIINYLTGEDLIKTGEVRKSDGRGRHTTTYREMIILPSGGIVIDTPGMREIQAWNDQDGLDRTFGDIEAMTTKCRFNDCKHQSEPGCAIKAAIDEGTLDAGRYQNYIKLQKELKFLEIRKDQKARKIENEKWKKITINHRNKEKFLRKTKRK